MTATTTTKLNIPSDALTGIGDKQKWRILAVISIIQFILLLDATIVNVALPAIKSDLVLTDASLTWIVNTYYIAAGSLLLFGGKLGDAFGIRKIFMFGIAIFGAFSFLAAIAPNANLLILGRAGQGLGEAFAAATGLAMVSLMFPSGPDRAKAFSIWAALGGIGSIVGVLLSGAITQYLSWRWVFGINVPLIVVLMLTALAIVPSFPRNAGTRLDFFNALCVVAGVFLMVIGIIGTGIETQTALRVGLAIAGAMLIALILMRCRKHENGIIPARLMRGSPRFLGYLIILVQASTSGALFYLGVLHLQGGLGMTPMQTGLAWLPFCFGFFPGIFLAQAISQKHSPKHAALVGLLISGAGFTFFAWAVNLDSYWLGMFPAMLVTSVGFGCVAPVAQSLATVELSEADAGAGAGITITIQQLSQVAGITLFVAVALANSGTDKTNIAVGGYVIAYAIAAVAMFATAVVVARSRSADAVSATDLNG